MRAGPSDWPIVGSLGRLPIRLRLTLAFALAMAVVLAGTGSFVYLRLASELDASLDAGLVARADDLAAAAASDVDEIALGGETSDHRDESFAQILAPDGRVLAASGQLRNQPLLSARELERATQGRVMLDLQPIPGVLDDPSRLLAAPAASEEVVRIVVVGASLVERDEALSGLVAQLLIIGPAALLGASLLGYLLATAAFRPIEAMRKRAASISGDQPDQRLPIPPQRDEVARLGETLNDMLTRLQAARVELESALERERQLVADASHELRTPLTRLKAELQLARRQPRSVHELEQAIDSATQETDHLTRLTNDLLVLARAQDGTLPIHLSEIDARELLTRVADRFQQPGRQAHRSLDVEAPRQLAMRGDPLRLEQALENLIDNALRHGEGAVCLTAIDTDNAIELHVTDDGPGFPDSFLEQAFQRFTRAETSRTSEGTGLGLPIVEAIARAHNGTAHATNRPTRGADTWITIDKPVRPSSTSSNGGFR